MTPVSRQNCVKSKFNKPTTVKLKLNIELREYSLRLIIYFTFMKLIRPQAPSDPEIAIGTE